MNLNRFFFFYFWTVFLKDILNTNFRDIYDRKGLNLYFRGSHLLGRVFAQNLERQYLSPYLLLGVMNVVSHTESKNRYIYRIFSMVLDSNVSFLVAYSSTCRGIYGTPFSCPHDPRRCQWVMPNVDILLDMLWLKQPFLSKSFKTFYQSLKIVSV